MPHRTRALDLTVGTLIKRAFVLISLGILCLIFITFVVQLQNGFYPCSLPHVSPKSVKGQGIDNYLSPLSRIEQHASPTNATSRDENNTKLSLHPLEFVHITKTGGTSIETAAANAGIAWGACKFKYRSQYQGLSKFGNVEKYKRKRNEWKCKYDTKTMMPWLVKLMFPSILILLFCISNDVCNLSALGIARRTNSNRERICTTVVKHSLLFVTLTTELSVNFST